MSRPRRAGDPTTWPEACGRCGEHHQIAASWPDARICGYCYQAAKRATGTCRCGHQGVLPGLVDGRPACRACSGVRVNLDCRSCGREQELYADGCCWRCALAVVVDRLLTNPSTGVMPPALTPLATALKSMNRANSGLTWIRQPHVTEFFNHLAVTAVINHDSLDALPASRTRDYVRGLLVEHGALPRRDERVARYQAWADLALQRVPSEENRDIVRRYIRWHHLRRMNGMDTVTEGTYLRSKQTVTVAINLLNWLTEQGAALTDLTQAHLDDWQSEGPTTREVASRFLRWAIRTRLVDPALTMTPHRRGTSSKLSAAQQDDALQQVVHSTELSARDRVAAVLVIVLGQQIEDVVRLTWDDITVTDELVAITISQTGIALPAPLDQPVRELASAPDHQTAAHPNSDWVFRGTTPGRHIQAATLRLRLSKVFHHPSRPSRHPARADPYRDTRRRARIQLRHHRTPRRSRGQHILPIRRHLGRKQR